MGQIKNIKLHIVTDIKGVNSTKPSHILTVGAVTTVVAPNSNSNNVSDATPSSGGKHSSSFGHVPDEESTRSCGNRRPRHEDPTGEGSKDCSGSCSSHQRSQGTQSKARTHLRSTVVFYHS